MPELKINHFKGINKKADPLDMDNHECQTMDGFDPTKKPGALVKRKGYTDQADVILPASYPSSWTIKSFFEFRVNKPSAKKIYIVHATVSSVDKIFVSDTYDGSSWNQAWVELTEKEESLTMDSSADTTHFVDAALSSSTNDYYNGWVVINWTRYTGSIVDDYVGASNTITLKTAIASMAASDSYSIYRFPIMHQLEGMTADTGSSTTQTWDIDDADNTEYYELISDFDDAYNGWTMGDIVNGSAAITDYEANYANHSRKITHGSIASHTDGSVCFIYNKTRTLNVDDSIQFRQRMNQCLMATGNASGRFPKQMPLWYGYIGKTYYFGDTDNVIEDGYYLEPAGLIAPQDLVLSDTTDTTDASTPLTSGSTYHFAVAYTYDGYQLGALTSINQAEATKVATLAANKKIQVELVIPYSSGISSNYGYSLNKRITAINIFITTDLNATTKEATWYSIYSIPIREDYNITFGGVKSDSSRTATERRPFGYRRGLSERTSITPSGRVTTRTPRKKSRVGWTGTDSYTIVINLTSTEWDNKGDFYTVHSGGMGGDRICYSFGDQTINHSVVGKLYRDDVENSMISFSPIKTDGSPSPDWFPSLNSLDISNYGIFNLTNIKIKNDYVYIVGDSKSMRMIMGSGLVPSFRNNSEYDYIGSEATNGMIVKDNGMYICSKKGIYFLDAYEHYISLKIEDPDDFPLGATDMSEAYMAFNGETNEIHIVFPTDTKLYTYNLLSKEWSIHSIGDAIKALVTGEDGEVYAADGSKIYRLNNGTTDDSTSIAPTWKSKIYSVGVNKEMVIREIEVVYKSNTVIDFDVYLDRGSAASWNASTDKQFAAATSLTSSRKQVPVTFRGNEIEFGISVPSASRASNTYVEIHAVNVIYDVENRID